MKSSGDFAEIIESSLSRWLAQCWQWNNTPAFGSLVTIPTKNRTLFGIVYHIQTGSIDPVRYPFAYQKTEEELLQEQPQIFEFLKTTFECLCLGYEEANKIVYALAPEPPTIHSFVTMSPEKVVKKFLSNPSYLSLIFGSASTIGNLDELLLALLLYQKKLNVIDKENIQIFIDYYSLLMNNDYFRLKFFLQRAQHVLEW